MNLRAVLTFEYRSEEEARTIAGALHPDNEIFVNVEVVGKVLKAVVSSDKASSLRHTLDDLLACVRVAEEAAGIEKQDGDRPEN